MKAEQLPFQMSGGGFWIGTLPAHDPDCPTCQEFPGQLLLTFTENPE